MKIKARNGQHWRIDEEHREPPNPHLYDLPEEYDIRLFINGLSGPDADLRKIGTRMARFPGLARYVVAYGNFLLDSENNRISEPIHATVFLGSRRLNNLLESLAHPTPPARAG